MGLMDKLLGLGSKVDAEKIGRNIGDGVAKAAFAIEDLARKAQPHAERAIDKGREFADAAERAFDQRRAEREALEAQRRSDAAAADRRPDAGHEAPVSSAEKKDGAL